MPRKTKNPQLEYRNSSGQPAAVPGNGSGQPYRQQIPERLRRSSPDFDRLWQQHDVGVYTNTAKHFQHPSWAG